MNPDDKNLNARWSGSEWRWAGAVFITCLGLGLWRALPWLDWGGQSEFTVAVMGLYPGRGTATPWAMIAMRALAALCPQNPAFALNAVAAFLFAASGALIFVAAARLARSLWFGALAVLLFVFMSDWPGLFDTGNQGPLVVFFAVVAVFAGSRLVWSNRARDLLIFCLLAGLAVVLNVYLAAAFVILGGLYIVFSARQGRAHHAASAAFMLLAGLAPLVMLVLRPHPDTAMGPLWAGDLAQIFGAPALSEFGSVFLNAAAAQPFYNMIPGFFIDVPSAPYFGMLAVGLIGLGAAADRLRNFSVCLLAGLFLVFLLYMPSLHGTAGLFTYLLLLNVLFLFVLGAGEILRAIERSSLSGIVGLKPVVTVLIVAAGLYSMTRDPGAMRTLRPGLTRPYHADVMRDMRRDAVFFLQPQDESRTLFGAAQQLRALRRDLILIYPGEFDDSAYREKLRRDYGKSLTIFNEDDYRKHRDQVEQMTRAPEGEAPSQAAQRKNLDYNLMVLNQSVLAGENSTSRRVYFDTIQTFLLNQHFNWLCFVPQKHVFRLMQNKFVPCSRDSLISNKEFMESLKNERSRKLARARKKDEVLDVDTMVDAFVFMMQETARMCDISREGFTTKCVYQELARALGRESEDLNPYPIIVSDCFERQFYMQPPQMLWYKKYVSGLKTIHDPQAAQQLSVFLTDIAEHAWIHNNKEYVYMLFKRAAEIDPGNERAHLFLLLIYEQKSMFDEAHKQTQILDRLLHERESQGRLNEYYMYMLADLYQRLGRSADAQKYLDMIKGQK